MIQKIKIENGCLLLWASAANANDNYDLIPLKSITYVTAVAPFDNADNLQRRSQCSIGVVGDVHSLKLNTVLYSHETDAAVEIQELMDAAKKIKDAVQNYHGGIRINKPKQIKS